MNRVDRTLADLAEHQQGLLTTTQARAAGLARHQIQARLRSGQLRSVARGVYRVSGAPTTTHQAILAAVLAVGQGAAASHLTAAWLFGLTTAPPVRPHLTVPFEASARSPLAVVHRARRGVVDVVTVEGIPVTTVARTLLDCSSVLGPGRLRSLVDEALHRQLVRAPQIEAWWDKVRLGPGRAGEVNLREVLEPWAIEVQPGSPAELRLVRQVREWGFPQPELQIPIVVDGRTVARNDMGWSGRRLGIEYDSARWHGPSAWSADESRHRLVEEAGWTLLHADRSDLEPGATRLRRALSARWSPLATTG